MTVPSYWMLADTEVPLAWDASQLSNFASYFKHALLFNEKVMLSDAQAVNCMNFRRLLTKDADFRQVLDQDLLAIAIRAPDNAPEGQSLTQVRDAFLQEGKSRTDNLSEFSNNKDLELINESCEVQLYNYSQLREHYTNSVIRLATLPHIASQLDSNDHARITELLQRESLRNQGLGRIYLQRGIGEELAAQGHEDVWLRTQSLLAKISDAPYITGIPTVMEANPVYSPLHQEAFDLVNAREPSSSQDPEVTGIIEIQSDLDISSYQYALQFLKIEDVFYLRESSEFKKFQKMSQKPITNNHDHVEIMMALCAYQQRIDELIIRRKLGLELNRGFKLHRKIKQLRKVGQEAGMFSLGLMLTDGLVGGALTMANYFVNEVLDKKEQTQDLQFDAHKKMLVNEIKRSGNTDRIGASRRMDERSETIYTSLTS